MVSDLNELGVGDTLPIVKDEITMEDTLDCDSTSIGDNAELNITGLEERKGTITETHKSDEESSVRKGIEKEKKLGHLRIHSNGQVFYKKINAIDIMESTQLGIQESVGELANSPERDVLMKDFMTVETKSFFSKTSESFSPRKSTFVFKTYAPIAFKHFRDLFGIQPDHFVASFCEDPPLELPNPGASGSLFYVTKNDEFIIKTVQHREANFLQKLLPGYYLNLNQNPLTLLPKFFGLYCFQRDSSNVRLVVMNNVLPSWVTIHQKFDLKGSTYKRSASKEELLKDSPTFKDLDFKEQFPEGIFLENNAYKNLMKTIQRDCTVLESFQIIDYSLLVGVHKVDKAKRDSITTAVEEEGMQVKEEKNNIPCGDGVFAIGVNTDDLDVENSSNTKNYELTNSPTKTGRKTSVRDSVFSGLPAWQSNGEKLLLFIGIIDILQSYRLRKRVEHVLKSIIHDGDSVSVHNPAFYAQRFQEFMSNSVFKRLPPSARVKKKKIHSRLKPIDKISELRS